MAKPIRVEDVSKWYELGRSTGDASIHVLDDVSFDVKEKEFITIVGPSGCGKTTLLKLLDGLVRPTTGRISLGGDAITAPRPEIAMVFQGFELFPWRTVLANVTFGLEIRRVDKEERRERAMEWIELTGLGGFENRYPHELSGGMQQRVGLARALVVGPQLLLMDEPFGALDAMTKDQMQGELLRLVERHDMTIVFITHDIREAIYLADRVFVMSHRPGRLIRDLEISIERPRWNRRMAVEADERFRSAHATIRRDLGLEDDAGPSTQSPTTVA